MQRDGQPLVCLTCNGSGFDLGGAPDLDAWLSNQQMAEADALSDCARDELLLDEGRDAAYGDLGL